MEFISTNLCNCGPSVPCPPATSQCPEIDGCLKVCNVIINSTDAESVGPCGKQGTFDITSIDGHVTTACGSDPIVWTLHSFDSNFFAIAEITPAGILTWTTNGADVAGKFGMLTVKVSCGILSAYGTVAIAIKDLCTGFIPSQTGEQCDPCTGLAIDQVAEAAIQEGLVTFPEETGTLIVSETTSFNLAGKRKVTIVPGVKLLSIGIIPTATGLFTVGTTDGGTDVVNENLDNLDPTDFDYGQTIGTSLDLYFEGNGQVTIYIE